MIWPDHVHFWSSLARLYSALPCVPRFRATNPVIPSSFRALARATIHGDFLSFMPAACCFLDMIFPFLFWQRSFLVRPPLVYKHEPFQTFRMEPVCDFFVMRLGLRALDAFLAALAL